MRRLIFTLLFVFFGLSLGAPARADPSTRITLEEGELALGSGVTERQRDTPDLFLAEGRGRMRPTFFTIPTTLDLDADTELYTSLAHHYGPHLRYGYLRHEVDVRFGVLRTFEDGLVSTSLALRTSLSLPDAQQELAGVLRPERTRALMLEGALALDLRDDPRDPHEGLYVRLSAAQAGLGGASSWDFLRLAAETRAYAPLALGLVLAARFSLGAMLVMDTHGLDPDTLYDLDELGPFTQQLEGGGPTSNRGFRRGNLGAIRRGVEHSTSVGTEHLRPAMVPGGTRRWEASVELRAPLSSRLDLALFADSGNVGREGFDFAAINLALGAGLRYQTDLGALRFGYAFRPERLQVLGANDPRPRACVDEQDIECRPVAGAGGSRGAWHLTLGEPF